MKPILELQEVSKHIKDFSIQKVSFSLEPGYIMGLVGPNGSGKTTLIQLILQQFSHYDGTIMVDGLDAKKHPLAAKEQIAFISEANTFFLEYDAITNARLYAPLYKTFDLELFQTTLASFDIRVQDQPLSTFSKGSLIKFQLAFALAHHPILYLMDEPTAGLDPIFRRDFLNILQDIVAKDGSSILIATHITSDLDKIADYIGFLGHGQLLRFCDREVLEEEQRELNGNLRLKISDHISKDIDLSNNLHRIK